MASKFSKVGAEYYNKYKNLNQWMITYFVIYPYFKLFFRAETQGRENIPENESFIIAATHSSYFDPLIVRMAMKRNVAFMAKEELFKVPVLSQIIEGLGAFSVNRKKLEISTIKSAKFIVFKTKWLLCLFPQGTRIPGRKVGKINKGIGYLAKVTGSRVLPVGIDIKRGVCPLFGKLVVKIGKPIDVCDSADEILDKWGQAINELVGYEYNKEECLGTTEADESASVE